VALADPAFGPSRAEGFAAVVAVVVVVPTHGRELEALLRDELAPPQPEPPATGPLFTLLRHLLQQPFDQAGGVPLPEHLIERTEAIPGAYLPSEAATLRKDLEKLLTPYGFRQRNDNVRHGDAIGTALLSAHRLRELEQRLAWAGIAVDGTTPVRAFANRSIVSSALVRPDSLAAERQAEALETAIVEWRRIELERYASVASLGSPLGTFRVWPLQLLFHTIGWCLVFQEDAIGTGVGLIRCERIDRQALARLQTLRHPSGGIFNWRRPGGPAAALPSPRLQPRAGAAHPALLLPGLVLCVPARGSSA
jgi:hypothetical protein